VWDFNVGCVKLQCFIAMFGELHALGMSDDKRQGKTVMTICAMAECCSLLQLAQRISRQPWRRHLRVYKLVLACRGGRPPGSRGMKSVCTALCCGTQPRKATTMLLPRALSSSTIWEDDEEDVVVVPVGPEPEQDRQLCPEGRVRGKALAGYKVAAPPHRRQLGGQQTLFSHTGAPPRPRSSAPPGKVAVLNFNFLAILRKQPTPAPPGGQPAAPGDPHRPPPPNAM